MSQPEDIFLKQLEVKLEYPVECAKDILNHSGQDTKNVNCDLIDIKEEFTYQDLENKVEGKYEDIYGCSNQLNILEDNKEGDFIIKTDEDIFLKQLEVKLEYPVECAKDILNHSGQDMENVNCDLIDIKEEFTYQDLENKVEGKYEDIYGCSNQLNILEDNKEGDFIIKTDEGIKNEFKYADIIHLKKEETPTKGINDVPIEPTENAIVAEHNNKSVTSSTFRRSRRKSKISLSCDLCNSSFTTKQGLIIHIRRHLGDKPYQCHQCATAFSQKSHLTRHIRIHTGDRPYQCHHCDVRYARKSSLVNHINFFHMKILNLYRCDRCPVQCASQENLIRHAERYHLVDENKRCNGKNRSRRKSKISFSCDLCNSSFTTKLGLIIHIRQHLGSKSYQCHRCDITFSKISSLTQHTRMHNRQRLYQCHHCDVRYALRSSLVNHINFIHMKILNRYRCDRCPAKCVSRENLIRHLERYHLVDESKRRNGKKQRVECYHCGDTFCDRSTLAKHMRQHTGERPYGCSYCGARFIRRPNLITHVRRHTGERPYKCDQCDATFARKDTLTKHMKIHTGGKPYRCEKCIDRFARKSTLKAHMKTHTNETPYMCSACKVGFHGKFSLNRHLKIHALEDATDLLRQSN